jgi:replicative DNA helicase
MDRILRSVIQVNSQPDTEDALQNWNRLNEHGLDFTSEEDSRIHTYLSEFYSQMSSPPDVSIMREFFEKKDDVEVVSRIEEIKNAQFHIRTNFLAIIRAEKEEQLTKSFLMLIRDASTITEHGRNLDKPVNGKKVIRGVTDAVNYLYEKLSDYTKIENGEKLEGVVTQDAEEVIDDYEVISKSDSYAGRNIIGFDAIDSAIGGHKSGEFWVHCAFSGELKCLSGSATVYDHSAGKRRSLKEIFESQNLPVVTSLYKEGEKLEFLPAKASHIFENGVQEVFRLTLSSGKSTTPTAGHKFKTLDSWVRLDQLKVGDAIAVPKETPSNGLSHLIAGVSWEKIESIESIGHEMTYDLCVPEHHSFIVDDIVAHNSTLAINYAYNNSYVCGKNIFYANLEMPYKQLRRQLFVLHSSHGKFVTEWHRQDIKRGSKEPYIGLDYRKVRDGKLSALDFERLKIVAQDFKATCRGNLYMWRPENNGVTVQEIQKRAEMFHNKYGCDGAIIDYLGLCRPKHRTSDAIAMINSVVTDARWFALNFARGKTLPVLALFQMNRQGKLRADKNDGRYDFAAISYANQIEKDADLITYTYLNDQLRKDGKFYLGSIKVRDDALFERVVGKIIWQSKRMKTIESSMLDSAVDAIQNSLNSNTFLRGSDMIT